MHITLDVLRRYTDLPEDPAEVRTLLDEVGLEVKRIDPAAPGVPLTLELLANRGDHHGYVGLAREIRGRTGGPLRLPALADVAVGEGPHPIRRQTALCPVYALTELVLDEARPVSAEATTLLESCGLAPVHPVVDATNVANLELGQPTHAFDADTIVGPVTIREASAGETALPLFAEARVEVPEGAIVIADDEKILAIAGVIGCQESRTTEATTRVLLEAAAFDPVSVRKTSRALGIHTDSSARFERGSDFALVADGGRRVCQLLVEAGWKVRGTMGVDSGWEDPARVVPFDPAACRAFLDVSEDDDALFERLGRYGFTPAEGGFRVPTHRLWDVEFAADLYEEIAKSIGYDNTPIGLPPVDMGALPTRIEQVQDTVADVLVGAGFYEVVTDGFHGRQLPEALGFTGDHPLAHHVETANALDRAYSLLKNEALGQAVQGVADNARMKRFDVKAFEFTRTFHPEASAPNGVCTERRLVWAIANGPERPATWDGAARPSDVYLLKGLVTELSRALRLPLQVGPVADEPLATALHPGRRAAVTLHGARIGLLGEVHPGVVQAFKLKKARPVYLELDLEALCADPVPYAFTEPPRVPPVTRNLAFTLPHGVATGEVADVMRSHGPDWLQGVAVVDRFDHEEDGESVSTFTFALTYGNEDADRTADEMNGVTEALVAAVEAALGERGVRLR